MQATQKPTVLHYTGYDSDHGGIVSVVRALASTGQFNCLLGANVGCVQHRLPPLAFMALPGMAGESTSARNFLRARAVAVAAREWLDGDANRVFHAHSRAGLLVGLWLRRLGQTRLAVSVHCYGRQRWFYRWASRQLGGQLFWLSPAMKRYYGLAGSGDGWTQCIPGCVPGRLEEMRPMRDVPHGVVRLGGIGALVPWKRWDLVLEALHALAPETRKKLHFAHIGGEADTAEARRYAAALRARTTALGLTGIVQWRGQQSSAEGLLREIDCLVIPSRHEPFSVAMLEALAVGVPVLAADCGGACDIVSPPQNGWLFASGDSNELSAAFSRLTHVESWRLLRIDRGNLGRFSASVVATQWSQVYSRLLGRGSV